MACLSSEYVIDVNDELPIRELDLNTIHPLNVKDTKNGAKYIVIGAPGTGKSTIIKDIIYSKKHITPVGHIFSGTEDSNSFFSDFFNPNFIFTADDMMKYLEKRDILLKPNNPVVMFKKRQQLASKFLEPINYNPWALEVFDDCTSDSKYFKKDIFQDLYKNGRHWRMLHISSFQFCLDLPTSIRTNINGAFIMKEGNPKMRERLFDNYSDGGMDKYEFNYIMDSLTDNYCSMYVNKKAKSNKVDETILFYKANPSRIPKDWKFGCKEFRDWKK